MAPKTLWIIIEILDILYIVSYIMQGLESTHRDTSVIVQFQEATVWLIAWIMWVKVCHS